MSEKVKEVEATETETANDPKIEEILKAVEEMTVLQLSQLVKAMEERFGVTASAPMMVAGAMPAAGGEAPAEAEEKTEFDVVLESIGSQKIQVIKVVRSLTNLGLKEAKELVESAPTAVKEAVNKEEADDVKAKLEEVGATVILK